MCYWGSFKWEKQLMHTCTVTTQEHCSLSSLICINPPAVTRAQNISPPKKDRQLFFKFLVEILINTLGCLHLLLSLSKGRVKIALWIRPVHSFPAVEMIGLPCFGLTLLSLRADTLHSLLWDVTDVQCINDRNDFFCPSGLSWRCMFALFSTVP